MRLLFVTSTRIGDAVLSTGVLRHLIETNPGTRVTVAAGRLAAPLFEAVPGLDRLLAIDKRPFKLHWLALWRAAALRRWDLAVDLRASALAYTLPARRRLVIGRRTPGLHRVEELAALLGVQPPPAPTVWLAPHHEAAAARIVAPGGAVLAVGPAANWIGKQWRGARFAELVGRLTAPDGLLPGARVAVVAGAHERPHAQPVLEAAPAARRIDLVGTADLPTIAACLRRCALFIGNDSGLMHLAAAAGTPTLGLFGPSPEERYRPWGAHAAVVRTRESCAELLAHAGDPGRVSESLMDSLTVAAVAQAAEALWTRVRAA